MLPVPDSVSLFSGRGSSDTSCCHPCAGWSQNEWPSSGTFVCVFHPDCDGSSLPSPFPSSSPPSPATSPSSHWLSPLAQRTRRDQRARHSSSGVAPSSRRRSSCQASTLESGSGICERSRLPSEHPWWNRVRQGWDPWRGLACRRCSGKVAPSRRGSFACWGGSYRRIVSLSAAPATRLRSCRRRFWL